MRDICKVNKFIAFRPTKAQQNQKHHSMS